MLGSLVFSPDEKGYQNKVEHENNDNKYAYEVDDMGNTPLHNAAMSPTRSVAQILRSLYRQVNVTNREGQTALHLAAMYGKVEDIRSLINAGAVLNIQDIYEKLPIDYAVYYNHPSVIPILYEAYAIANVTINATSLIETGIRTGKVEILEALHTIPDCVAALRTPNDFLHQAASLGYLPILSHFIEHLPPEHITSQDKHARMPLSYAIMNSNLAMVKALLNAGASVDKISTRKYTSLHYAALSGDSAMITFIYSQLGEKASDMLYHVAFGRRLPIDVAAAEGHLLAVEWFLGKMQTIGRVPAHIDALRYAVRNGHLKIFKTLLSFQMHGEFVYVIPPYRPNTENFLHVAAESNQTNILFDLLDRVTDTSVLNIVDLRNRAPLHFACSAGNIAAVRRLLEMGANKALITQRDREKFTSNRDGILTLLGDLE